MSSGKKSILKLRGFGNQVPDLQSSPDPSTEERAPDSPSQDDWVKCSKCRKWRIVCVREVKVLSLPRNWECGAMTWLPGLNRCEVPELTTTAAGYEVLGVPAENINFDLLNVAPHDRASTSTRSRSVALSTNRIQKRKCFPEDLKPRMRGQCKSRVTDQRVAAVKTGIRVKLKLRTPEAANDLSLYEPRRSEFRSLRLSRQSALKTNFTAGADENVVILKAHTVRPCENHVLSERGPRPEAGAATKLLEKTPRLKVIRDEPGCLQFGSLGVFPQSQLKMNSKAPRVEQSSAWKGQYQTEEPDLTERGAVAASATKETVLSAVTIGAPARELSLEALTARASSKKPRQKAPNIEVVSKELVEEAATIKVPVKKTVHEAATMKVPVKKTMQEASTIKVPVKKTMQEAANSKIPVKKTVQEAATSKIPGKKKMQEAPESATFKVPAKKKLQEAPSIEVPRRKWMEEVPTIEVPMNEGKQQALSTEVPKNKSTPQFVHISRNGENANFAARKVATLVPIEERTSEIPRKESAKVPDSNREIQIKNTLKKGEGDFWLMNATKEAAALIKVAGDCRKRMPHMEDERPIADLYLQAGLKYLKTARHQEVIYTESQESADISYAQNYMTAAETFDDCTKIYENVADHGKAALCHVLSGAARMRLLTVIMPADIEVLSHAEGSLSPGRKIPVSLPQSLHSTLERFLQSSASISPMLDSWMKARACLASAEASGGDSKYMKVILEVRKVCEMAMFDDFEKLISQVYLAMEAFT